MVDNSSKTNDQVVADTASNLKDFHPLTEEDAQILNRDSGRDFNLNYINQLLLKLDKQRPDNMFRSKKAVLSYMTESLKNELRQIVNVNNEDFEFKQSNDLAHKEGYLAKVEESTDTNKIS
ncbi:MAG: hypothetical protein ACRYE9_04415 [Janthinobacterium lividum]